MTKQWIVAMTDDEAPTMPAWIPGPFPFLPPPFDGGRLENCCKLDLAAHDGPTTITFHDDIFQHKKGNGSKNGVVAIGEEIIELGRVIGWIKTKLYHYEKKRGKRKRVYEYMPVFEMRWCGGPWQKPQVDIPITPA
jgi:hypothetical protein